MPRKYNMGEWANETISPEHKSLRSIHTTRFVTFFAFGTVCTLSSNVININMILGEGKKKKNMNK